ncbi:MAG: hypothetical protein KBD27_00885 [Candidatus Moranbacteria bacterium]|nr:hypothetical protein [Candidatus Moranbacteria bacterium]
MTHSDVNQWYKDVVDAVAHHDAGPAFRLLKQWDAMVALFPMEWTSNAQFQRTLPVLRKDLWYTAFPELPIADAQKILSSEILECMQRDMNLADLLSSRYTSISYGMQDKERLALKEAILKNVELIGGVTIGEWLATFDKLFKPEEREESGVNDFMTRDSRVAGLSKDEQGVLHVVLDMYDKYLATELLSIFDVAVIVSGQPAQKTPSDTQSRFGGQPSTAKLPLLQALSKYEQLGNQLITRERIKLRSQTETVRPSLLYWIKYYRDELGVGHHSTVDRGNFLFRSENGKRLSPEERERVNLVLKSVEENFPVEVDTEQSVIIFPPFVVEEAPVSQMPPTPPLAPKRSATLPPEVFQPSRSAGAGAPAPQAGSLTFTSGHVMPGERETAQARQNTAPQAPPAPRPAVPTSKSNPFHIRPVSLGEQDK